MGDSRNSYLQIQRYKIFFQTKAVSYILLTKKDSAKCVSVVRHFDRIGASVQAEIRKLAQLHSESVEKYKTNRLCRAIKSYGFCRCVKTN